MTLLCSRQGANYVSDTVSGKSSEASKEANKGTFLRSSWSSIYTDILLGVAKSDDASLGTRASAAKDAVSDKMDESSSKVSCFIRTQSFGGSRLTLAQASASVNKEAAKH